MSLRTVRRRTIAKVISLVVLVAMLLATNGIGYAAPKASVSARRVSVAKPAAPAAPEAAPTAPAKVARKARAVQAAPVEVPKIAPDDGSIVLPECHGWIHVYKFEDYDGDGSWDSDEPPVAGWTFYLTKSGRTSTLVTDASGHAVKQSEVGSWMITEEARVGWSYVLPKCITLTENENESLYFGNHRWCETKTMKLSYPDAPSGATFYVKFKPVVGSSERVNLTRDGDSSLWVGTKSVVWKAPFSLEWWMSYAGGDVMLGSTGPECIDRPTDNLFEYDSSISGAKFDDLDGDGARDAGEPGLAGWVIRLYPAVGDIAPTTAVGWIAETTTGDGGAWSFSQLPPGSYRVEEVMQTGWTQTRAPAGGLAVADGVHLTGLDFGNTRTDVLKRFELSLDAVKPGVTFYAEYMVNGESMHTDLAASDDPHVFDAEETYKWGDVLGMVSWYAVYGAEHIWLGSTDGETLDQAETLNSFYYDPMVGGHKFNDLDGDGVWDQGEPALAGWTIQLWRVPGQVPQSDVSPAVAAELYATAVTAADGSYAFEGALPGQYSVTEVMQDGWKQTLAPGGTFEIANGTEISTLDFGNVRLYPDLTIVKSVEPALVVREDVVTYTLTWENVGDYLAAGYTITDDFDERYMSVVDANGGVVADGKITWTFAEPLSPGDAPLSMSYTMQVLATVPEDVTVVDNTVVIAHPEDTDLTNNSDDASIEIEPFAPFTPEDPTPEDEPFLPFTGGDIGLLLFAAAVSAGLGIALRRRSA